MDKVFQILVVFALLMLIINYSVRARENKFLPFYLFKQINLPFPGDPEWDAIAVGLLSVGVHGDLEGPAEESAERVQATETAQATDKENQLTFRSGEAATLSVMGISTGEFITTILLEDHADELGFDPAARLIFSYNREGALSIIRQTGRDRYKIMQRMLVPKGCSVLLPDPDTGKIYLVGEKTIYVYSNG